MFRSIFEQHITGTDAIVGVLKDPARVHDAQVKQDEEVVLDMTVNMSCRCHAWVEPFEKLDVMTQGDTVAELLSEKQEWCIL